MADEDLVGDGATSGVVDAHLVQPDHQTITVAQCTKGKLMLLVNDVCFGEFLF